MKRATVFLTLLSAFVMFSAGAASAVSPYEQHRYNRNKNAVSIIGGGIGGTYIKYAVDLANVLDDVSGEGMRILPVIGYGGGQNVLDMLFLRGIDMGLTQQDHLAFWKRKNPQLYGDLEHRIRYITKLYNSEYHLIARKDIKSFKDLRGKKVNFWRPWSATDIGGQTIFDILGIQVDHTEYIDTPKALEMVKKGEIAATTLLAGAPISAYAELKPEDGLHIVPLGPDSLTAEQYAKLLEVYLPVKLTHDQYPNMIPPGKEVNSVASGVVLAVYNWKEDSERYRKVADFVNAFFSNFDKLLVEPRHPKWKTVNLAAKVPGWTRFKAAEEWLAQASANPSPETQQAFSAFLQRSNQTSNGKPISNKEKEQLFQEFVEWWRTRPQQQ